MPQPFSFSAVMFDLDGVLIDTTELHYRVWDQFARSKGVFPTRQQLLATNGQRADENIRRWLGEALSDHQIAALTAERDMQFHERLGIEAVPAVPGAVDFVRALTRAGVPVGVATSAIPENAQLSISKIGLADELQAVVTAADVKNGKPDPEPYLKLAALLNMPASDCVVIEDSVSGVRSGKAAGAKVLAIGTTFPMEQLAAEGPDWLIRGFQELPSELCL